MADSILVIDDNKDIRENIVEILDLAGYHAIAAENGKKGVESALKEHPSLIICDIMMPELDGYGVLHLLRKNPETQTIPFIFLTAKTERSDFRKGMEMGADDYITKPFEDIELLSAVETRLKKSAILGKSYDPSYNGLKNFLADVKNAGMLQQLNEQLDPVHYERKQILYKEGKKPRFLYYLMKGKLKCLKTNEDGKEYIINLHNEGDFIGYAPLLEDSYYQDSAIILEDAEIIHIPKDDFLQMVYSDIHVAAQFLHIITHNVKEKEDRLLKIAYSSLRKRVATALVEIVNKFNLNEHSTPIEISREEIAQYVGTATESLIRTLSDFKEENLIEIKNGRILVKHIDKLKNLSY